MVRMENLVRNLGDSLHFSDVCDGHRLRAQYFARFSSIACNVYKLEVKHNALDERSSTFLALGTSFMKDSISMGREGCELSGVPVNTGSFTCFLLLLTSCYVAQFLIGHRLHGPGVGDTCSRSPLTELWGVGNLVEGQIPGFHSIYWIRKVIQE